METAGDRTPNVQLPKLAKLSLNSVCLMISIAAFPLDPFFVVYCRVAGPKYARGGQCIGGALPFPEAEIVPETCFDADLIVNDSENPQCPPTR